MNRSNIPTKSRTICPAFTLIELLVVISIIALLVSILLPALGRARATAQKLVCSSNLRSFSLCLDMYAIQNKDFYPVFYYYNDYPSSHFFIGNGESAWPWNPEFRKMMKIEVANGDYWPKSKACPTSVLAANSTTDYNGNSLRSAETYIPYSYGMNVAGLLSESEQNNTWYCPDITLKLGDVRGRWQRKLITTPSRSMQMADATNFGYRPEYSGFSDYSQALDSDMTGHSKRPAYRHDAGVNSAHWDGHVASYKYTQIENKSRKTDIPQGMPWLISQKWGI